MQNPNMRDGCRQLQNWQMEISRTVLVIHKLYRKLIVVFFTCMRLGVKECIPQYGVAVLKIKKIVFPLIPVLNTEKVLLTNKGNCLVLFLELYLILCKDFDKNNKSTTCVSTNCFCHFSVWYFAGIFNAHLRICYMQLCHGQYS